MWSQWAVDETTNLVINREQPDLQRRRKPQVLGPIAAVILVVILIALTRRHGEHLDLSSVLQGAKLLGSTKDSGGVSRFDVYETNRPIADLANILKEAGWKPTTRSYGSEYVYPNRQPGFSEVSVVLLDAGRSRTIEVKWRTSALTPLEASTLAEAIAHPSELPHRDKDEDAKRKEMAPILDELNVIRDKIVIQKELSKADAKFLVTTIQHGEYSCVAHACIDLELASTNRLYSKKKLLNLIEKQSSLPDAPLIFLMDYCGLMKVESPTDKRLNDEIHEILARNSNRRNFDPIEKRFVLKVLANPFQSNRILAGYVFYSKQELDPSTYAWMSELINDEIQKSNGNGRLLWKYIARTSEAKSRPRGAGRSRIATKAAFRT